MSVSLLKFIGRNARQIKLAPVAVGGSSQQNFASKQQRRSLHDELNEGLRRAEQKDIYQVCGVEYEHSGPKNPSPAGEATPVVVRNSNGSPTDSLTATMTVGPTGEIPVKDFTFFDIYQSFHRERVPERVVHAKGAGAFGHFEVTSHDITKYCKANLFSDVGKKTPVGVRFSTVSLERGSQDTVKDPRGFAVKFYTEEGNWDMVNNNTPLFFIRDPMLFPSLIHILKRNPATNLRDMDMFWDFMSLRKESTHQITYLFGDRGVPQSYRFMNGYGSNTFKTVNRHGEGFYVKWHVKSDQGVKNLSVATANELLSADPDYSTRDLFTAIQKKDFPSWTVSVQVMPVAEASSVAKKYDPFDATKIWPHSDFPLQEVGRMVLDRNPRNYYAEVEQLAFAVSHLARFTTTASFVRVSYSYAFSAQVPGIEPSPDKLLQGRLFSYKDAHMHRLGVNYQSISVNKPLGVRDGLHNFQRDGCMRVDGNGLDGPNYFPNSFNGPQPQPEAMMQPVMASGEICRVERGDEDYFTQCGDLFRKVMDRPQQERLAANIASSLVHAREFIQERAVANFTAVDPEYGSLVTQNLHLLRKGEKALPTLMAVPPF